MLLGAFVINSEDLLQGDLCVEGREEDLIGVVFTFLEVLYILCLTDDLWVGDGESSVTWS